MNQQIEFDILTEDNPEPMYNDIAEIMTEILASQKAYWKISGEEVPTEQLKQRVRKIHSEDLELLVSQFKAQNVEIKNIKSYLVKCLYNLPTTGNAYFENRVRADGCL